MKKISIYTDGSCLYNPGPGGIGCIFKYNNIIKQYSTGFCFSTNNRMELIAIIIALNLLKNTFNITLYTDSKYVYLGITLWIYNWKKNNWHTSKKQKLKNYDLWITLINLIKYHQITWNWIKSHNNYKENIKCDLLAKKASLNPNNIDYYRYGRDLNP